MYHIIAYPGIHPGELGEAFSSIKQPFFGDVYAVAGAFAVGFQYLGQPGKNFPDKRLILKFSVILVQHHKQP